MVLGGGEEADFAPGLVNILHVLQAFCVAGLVQRAPSESKVAWDV